MAKSKYDRTSQSYCGQTYVARVFDMLEIPDGRRMPDLMSRHGHLELTLFLEVKTSRNGNKASLNDFQLHYSVRTIEDYFLMFREKPTGLGDSLLSGEPSTTYYNCVSRTDGIENGELEKPFHDLMFTFGDYHIVPGEFAFYDFAFEVARKGKEPLRAVIERLKNVVKASIYSGYAGRKQSGTWQDIHTRDILALFHRQLALTTPSGVQRLEAISESYPSIRTWRRVCIPGPNNTSIYILCKPEHENLFDVSLRQDVERRNPVLEQVIEERMLASEMLKQIPDSQQGNLFEEFVSHKQDSSWGTCENLF